MSDAVAMRETDLRITTVRGPLAVFAMIAFLEVLSRSGFPVPQVESFLILAVAYVAFVDGMVPGLFGAILAVGYSAYAFSPQGEEFHAALFPWERLMVVGGAIPILALMVGLLRRELEQAGEREEIARRDLGRVVETLPAGFFTLDPEGRPGYVNQRAAEVIGDPGTIDSAAEVIGAVSRIGEAVEDRLVAALREGETAIFESYHEESETWYDVQIYPFQEGVAVYFVDVTERRRTRNQAQSMQRLQAIGQLSGGIAHDFNNLLTAIKGYNELAMAGVDPEDPIRESLIEVHKAADRASTLTRQLLAYSRQQLLRPDVVDLNETVSDMESMLRSLLPDDISLEVNLAPDLDPVQVDGSQLEQILMNLVVNAVDAMSAGGRLEVETSRARFAEPERRGDYVVEAGEYCRLVVRDTGGGMEEETRKHVFEPFFTTKKPGSGTGLGLATVYGIVKQSGGYIEVESRPGSGTMFEVLLPRSERSVIESSEGGGSRAMSEKSEKSVLVIEDDDAIRSLAVCALSTRGFEVVAVADGEEALELAAERETPFDVIFADVVLPGRSGREVGRSLSRRWPEARVIYTSGYTDDHIIEGGIARGVLEPGIDFLHKPFTPAELAEKIEEAMERGRESAGQVAS